MLQEFWRSSPVTVRRCYHGGRRLLPYWKAIATMVDTKCYDRTAALVLCCEGHGGQPRRSWTPARGQANRPCQEPPVRVERGHGGVMVCFFFLEPDEFPFA